MPVTDSASSPWLDPDDLATWRAFIFSARQLEQALDRQLQTDAGIPHSWFGMLTALSEDPERTMRQSDLAAAADFSAARASHAVAQMVGRGWLTRTAVAGDRRVIRLTLTDDGLAALNEMARGHARAVQTLFVSPLTLRQRSALRAACTQLLRAAPAERACAAQPAPT